MYNWIRVSDRVPNINEKVLVVHGDSIIISRYDGFDWRDGDFIIKKPTHWQLLPDLPYISSLDAPKSFDDLKERMNF